MSRSTRNMLVASIAALCAIGCAKEHGPQSITSSETKLPSAQTLIKAHPCLEAPSAVAPWAKPLLGAWKIVSVDDKAYNGSEAIVLEPGRAMHVKDGTIRDSYRLGFLGEPKRLCFTNGDEIMMWTPTGGEHKARFDVTGLKERAFAGLRPYSASWTLEQLEKEPQVEPPSDALEAASVGDLKALRENHAAGGYLDVYNHQGFSSLMAAASGHHDAAMRFLIENGVDLNATTSLQQTALHRAALAGNLLGVRMLVAAGADVNASDERGKGPLCAALDEIHYLKIADVLVHAGASFEPCEQYTSIFSSGWSSASDDPELALRFARVAVEVWGRDLNPEDTSKSPLLAAASGHLEVVSYLIEKGARVSVGDNVRYTPFSAALSSENPIAMLKILLNTGAELAGGDRLLVEAVRERQFDTAKFLLDKGTDPTYLIETLSDELEELKDQDEEVADFVEYLEATEEEL